MYKMDRIFLFDFNKCVYDLVMYRMGSYLHFISFLFSALNSCAAKAITSFDFWKNQNKFATNQSGTEGNSSFTFR